MNTTTGRRRRDPRVLKRRRRDLRFAFDHVFGPDASQEQVFRNTTKPILKGVLEGYNASVFCYGATGAGKTHTMLGHNGEPGVILLTVQELFREIDARKDDVSCEVALSYLEVYNETIRDLLEPSDNMLAIREDASKGVIVNGLSVHRPRNASHLIQMLQRGNANRTQHPTDANATSSRSHAVFTIHVHQKPRTADLSAGVRVAKMTLIDLAGSERAAATNNRGARMREGSNINKSLLALGNCINALASGGKKASYVPYRNSKLTRILKDSLGGNCRTVMIANCSPSSLTYEDTYNTLQYANRAKQIKVKITQNVVNVDYHVSRYKKIVAELRTEVAELKEKLVRGGSDASKQRASSAKIAPFRKALTEIFTERNNIIAQIVAKEARARECESDMRRYGRDIHRVEMLLRSAPELCSEERYKTLKDDMAATLATKNGLVKELEESRAGLQANNGRSESWQGEVETQTASADLEMLKWEYRCRALEQEAAGLQQRNAALTADLKLEFKESKRSSKVVSTMLGALVEARQALMKLDAGADTSALDAALRFALSGKEVVWPDQSQDARRRDENSGPRNTSAFASPKPGKASQSLCVASPDQLHTPTHAEARARAPMRSVSRSISRSKLSSSTAVSAIPSPAGTPSRIPTPSKSASGRKKRRSPAMMATPLELRTPSHWAVPQATGKLSSTPVPQAPAPAPEEPAELANVLPTLRCSAVRPDPSKTHTKAAGGRRGLRRSNSTPALNMTAALESASDDALPPKRRATRTKMARQASASRLGRTFTASPVQRLPVIESPAPAAKSAAGGDDSDNDDANSTFTMEDQPPTSSPQKHSSSSAKAKRAQQAKLKVAKEMSQAKLKVAPETSAAPTSSSGSLSATYTKLTSMQSKANVRREGGLRRLNGLNGQKMRRAQSASALEKPVPRYMRATVATNARNAQRA